jgi:hypothetical protein
MKAHQSNFPVVPLKRSASGGQLHFLAFSVDELPPRLHRTSREGAFASFQI